MIAFQGNATTRIYQSKHTLANILPVHGFGAIGPVVYADHLGPWRRTRERTGPHAHAGIDVLTYVLGGESEYHDSLGNRGHVGAGGAHWLRAASGAIHSETHRSLGKESFQALDIWLRLSEEQQESAPSYRLIFPQTIPEAIHNRSKLRLISGRLPTLFADAGPVPSVNQSLLCHANIGSGDRLHLPAALRAELGLYVIAGSIQVDPQRPDLERGMVVILTTAREHLLSNLSEGSTDVLIFGGDRAIRPLLYRRSFVYNTVEDIADAEKRLTRGEMGNLT